MGSFANSWPARLSGANPLRQPGSNRRHDLASLGHGIEIRARDGGDIEVRATLDVALQEPTLAADVINYGHLATDQNALKNISAAILGIFGGQDRGIPVEDVKQFQKTLEGMGKRVEIKIYSDAGHAFENPNNKEGYRAEDAADAWKRTLTFLADTLKT